MYALLEHDLVNVFNEQNHERHFRKNLTSDGSRTVSLDLTVDDEVKTVYVNEQDHVASVTTKFCLDEHIDSVDGCYELYQELVQLVFRLDGSKARPAYLAPERAHCDLDTASVDTCPPVQPARVFRCRRVAHSRKRYAVLFLPGLRFGQTRVVRHVAGDKAHIHVFQHIKRDAYPSFGARQCQGIRSFFRGDGALRQHRVGPRVSSRPERGGALPQSGGDGMRRHHNRGV